MGLLTSVNNINYKLEEEKKAKEAERKAKEKERQKAKEEKEIKEQIKKEITFYLQDTFKNYLLENGSTTIYEFYNIEKKEIILNNILGQYTIIKTIKTKTLKAHDIEYIEHKDFIIEYFNNNYYKILKQVEAEAKKNEEYKIYKHITTPKEESKINYDINNIDNTNDINYKQIKKEKQQRILKTICYTFAGIVFLPLGFILLILYFTCKKQK